MTWIHHVEQNQGCGSVFQIHSFLVQSHVWYSGNSWHVYTDSKTFEISLDTKISAQFCILVIWPDPAWGWAALIKSFKSTRDRPLQISSNGTDVLSSLLDRDLSAQLMLACRVLMNGLVSHQVQCDFQSQWSQWHYKGLSAAQSTLITKPESDTAWTPGQPFANVDIKTKLNSELVRPLGRYPWPSLRHPGPKFPVNHAWQSKQWQSETY